MNGQDTLQQVQIEMLGRYRVLRRLGRGGMGEVWLCDDQRLNRQVAVKTLPARNQQDKAFVQRFEHEAKAAAALHHPHILAVHDYGKQELPNGTMLTYIVMPYIGGGSLAERAAYYTRQQRLMPSEEALAFLTQMAEAIDYAHKQHILHRDIKPDNMLLREEGWLLLADFGIARMVSSDEHLTTAGRSFGTPEFMAPEQARGEAEVTSDNYSLAVVAYLLLTGRLPFQGDTAIATVMQHMTEAPPAPRQFNPFLSPACEQILLQGLAKDPAQRPALAQEFVAQLARAIHAMGYQATALQTIHELPDLAFKDSLPALPALDTRRAPISRRQLLVIGSLAATALVGLGAGAWGIARDISAANTMQLPAQPTVSARPSSSGTNKPVLVLTGHSQFAHALLWSRDSSFLISAGKDNQVLRWDIAHLLQQPSRPALIPLYTNQLRCYPFNLSLLPAWSPDQSRLVVGNQNQGNNSVDAVICTPDLKIQSRFTLQYQLTGDNSFAPAFTGISWPFARYIVFSSNEQMSVQDTTAVDRLYVIDVEHIQQRWPVLTTNKMQRVALPDRTKALHFSAAALESPVIYSRKVVASPTSPTLFAATDNDVIALYDVQRRTFTRLLSTDDPTALQTLPYGQSPWYPQVTTLAWSPDGRYLAGNYFSTNLIYLWDLQNTRPRLKNGMQMPDFAIGKDGHTSPITDLAWSPDEHYLASSSLDTTVIVWKMDGA